VVLSLLLELTRIYAPLFVVKQLDISKLQTESFVPPATRAEQNSRFGVLIKLSYLKLKSLSKLKKKSMAKLLKDRLIF